MYQIPDIVPPNKQVGGDAWYPVAGEHTAWAQYVQDQWISIFKNAGKAWVQYVQDQARKKRNSAITRVLLDEKSI